MENEGILKRANSKLKKGKLKAKKLLKLLY